MNFKIFQSLFNLGFITGVFKLVCPYLAILSTYTHAKKKPHQSFMLFPL